MFINVDTETAKNIVQKSDNCNISTFNITHRKYIAQHHYYKYIRLEMNDQPQEFVRTRKTLCTSLKPLRDTERDGISYIV